jgi:serine protease inhibitor
LDDPRVGCEVTEWISEQTRGLLAPNVDLSPLALACLVSALYFKDAWDAPFEGSLTEIKPFHTPDGDVQAAFMQGERDCTVIDSGDYVAFALWLSSGARMLFALNDNGQIDADIAIDLFERLSNNKTDWEPVELEIPRFECETTVSDLASLLEEAGVTTAAAMELEPMVGSEITPTQLVHGAKLAVDEDGVEAGAYTMMVVCAGLPPEDPPKPRKIVLDKPFAVGLVSRTGAPLFLGNVAIPSDDIIVWREIDTDDRMDVWRDEEIEGCCRITVEADRERNWQEITCGIYGCMVHTVFARTYPKASEKFEDIKRDLEDYARHCEDGGFDSTAWIRAFVDRWK